GVGADGIAHDPVVTLNSSAQRSADAAGTGDGVVVADVADGQNVADDAVAVAVDGINVGGDVIQNHLALQFSALVGVETNVVGVVIELQRVHIQLAGGGVGRLTVEPDQRLVFVGNSAALGRGRGSGFRIEQYA